LRTGPHRPDEIARHASKGRESLGVHFHQRSNDLEDVAPGGKVAASAVDHHGLDRVVKRAGTKKIGEFAVAFKRQRVLPLGSVQPHGSTRSTTANKKWFGE